MIKNLEIRPEESKDYSQITQVSNLAFGRENEAKLIEKIRESNNYLPELSLIAQLDNKIVGHIMFSYVDLVGKDSIKILALAPVAVLPQYQNRGIGSLLIKTSLEMAENTASPMVIVLGDSKFYSRFGFEPAVNYGLKSTFDVADEYFMVKFLAKEDKSYHGRIKYPSAFKNV